MSSPRHPIHPAFRWVRTCGFTANAAVETRLNDGSVRVEQWIWTPEVGWDRYVETIDPEAFARWDLAAAPEVRCADFDAWVRTATIGELMAALGVS